jgi:uncharacterized protein YbjT (DUF2867 family)
MFLIQNSLCRQVNRLPFYLETQQENGTMQNSPILIIGKNAKTGLRVDRRLQALGYTTRAVSRSTSPAFDWEDPNTWHAALEGTESAYVTFYPDLAISTAEQTIHDFVALAKVTGLRHVVLLSGRGEAGAERAEAVLEASGLDWNVVRANWFMQNFSESFMIEGILSGELKLPASDIVEPFVDVDDIADVAVAALTRPELRNRLFEVSGPRALTFGQCAAEISQAVGYPVNYTRIPIEDFIQVLRDQGAPDELLWLMRELFTVVFDGRNSSPTSGVEEALGRPATDFSEYVQKVMATGAWDQSGMLQQA